MRWSGGRQSRLRVCRTVHPMGLYGGGRALSLQRPLRVSTIGRKRSNARLPRGTDKERLI
ncbi:hypothetical protein MPC4_50054 [Methylocella tundrae]|uniref:Uncharacterized protein n=1 Tax=Methylocella tundrae TaxID=227605 RepID=A0A8B6MCJ8_METTU|nr:hypothetical protein MPC1_280004 [Methylocella tundrae]VTZ51746.1 hypothetical protein MPC4_50054 [Methylocella tundrae]